MKVLECSEFCTHLACYKFTEQHYYVHEPHSEQHYCRDHFFMGKKGTKNLLFPQSISCFAGVPAYPSLYGPLEYKRGPSKSRWAGHWYNIDQDKNIHGGGGLVTKSCLTLAIPWTIAHQVPLSMGFSRQEYWSG